MIDASLVAAFASACCAVFAYCAYKLSRLHMHCSILNQCISDMLRNPSAAEAIAKTTLDNLIRDGYMKETNR
jgi:hypothetical protein